MPRLTKKKKKRNGSDLWLLTSACKYYDKNATDGKVSNDLCAGLAAYRGRVKFKARGLGGSSEGRRSGGGSIEMHYPSRERARTLGAGSVARTLHTDTVIELHRAFGAATSLLAAAAATARIYWATVWVRGWWRRAAVPRIGIVRKMTGFVGYAAGGGWRSGGGGVLRAPPDRRTVAVWPIFLEWNISNFKIRSKSCWSLIYSKRICNQFAEKVIL